MLNPSLPMTARLHCTPQSKTAKPRVGGCEGLCAHPARRMASVHPPGTETRCWSLCTQMLREQFSPSKFLEVRQKEAGRLGSSPSLPVRFPTLTAPQLGLTGLRQNAQGKGNAGGSKKEQDKSRASQVTPGRLQRPAVRAAFRAFTDRGRDFRNCLERLAGVHFWGLFRGENHELASAFPEPLLSQRFEAGSTVAPGRFWA